MKLEKSLIFCALILTFTSMHVLCAVIQRKPFEFMYMAHKETRIKDLSPYFSGFNLTFAFEDTNHPDYMTITPKLVEQHRTKYNIKATIGISHVTTTESGAFSTLYLYSLEDAKLYHGKFPTPMTPPDLGDGWVFGSPNDFICYDLYEEPLHSYVIIDCVRYKDPEDYENFIYVLDVESKTIVSSKSTQSSVPGLPYPSDRHILQISRSWFLRFEPAREYPQEFPVDTYIEFWNVTDLTAPTIAFTLNGEAFNLAEGLNAQDIKHFREEIFVLDQEFGCFRFTVESIRGNVEPRYYFLSFPGRKLDKLHVYAEYFEGAFRLIVLISDLTTVYEFDWTDPTHPILLGDYQIGRLLSSVTDKLWLAQEFLLVQTAQENDTARTWTTNLQVYRRGTRLYDEIYCFVNYTSSVFGTNAFFNPARLEIAVITDSFGSTCTLNSSILTVSPTTGPKIDKLFITASDSFGVVKGELTVDFLGPEDPMTSIRPSGTKPPVNISAFNLDVFRVPLADFVVGPSLKFSTSSKDFTSDIRFGPRVNITLDGADISARKNILYAQWENDGPTSYMLFLQNSTELTVYFCEIINDQLELPCKRRYGLTTTVNVKVQALITGRDLFAVMFANSHILSFYDKGSGGLVEQMDLPDGCNDIMYTTYRRSELFFCAQLHSQRIQVFSDFVSIANLTVASSPKYIYTNNDINTILFINNIDSLVAVEIGSWRQLFKLSTPLTQPDTKWHIAVSRDVLAIISETANQIDEYSLFNLENPFLMRSYPLYNLNISLGTDFTAFDYSAMTSMLLLSAIDNEFNHYLLIYAMGKMTPELLYRKVDLKETIPFKNCFVQTASAPDYDYFIVVTENIFYAGAVQTSPWIQIKPSENIKQIDQVHDYALAVDVTNEFDSLPVVLEFKLNMWLSHDALTESAAAGSIDLDNLIVVDRNKPLPQAFSIPLHTLYNGSVLNSSFTCAFEHDCLTSRIIFRDHFALNTATVNVPSVDFVDFAVSSSAVYSLTTSRIFVHETKNNTQIRSILDISFPGVPSQLLSCQHLALDPNEVYLIVQCLDTYALDGYVGLILLNSFAPQMITYIKSIQMTYVWDMILLDDFLYVLSNPSTMNAQDSTVLIYQINLNNDNVTKVITNPVNIDGLSIELDSLDVSSIQVALNTSAPLQDRSHILFMLNPHYGLHITNFTFAHSAYATTSASYSLYENLAAFNITPDIRFAGLIATPTVNPNVFRIIVTSANFHHFQFELDLATGTFTILQVFQKYSSLQVSSRIRSANEYFLIYAYPQDPDAATLTQALLAYRHSLDDHGVTKTGEGGTVIYKNAHAGLLRNSTKWARDLQFNFIEAGDGVHVYVPGQVSKWTSYDFLGDVQVVIVTNDIQSEAGDLFAGNDYSTVRVSLKIIDQSWFMKNFVYIVVITNCVIMAIFILYGLRYFKKLEGKAAVKLIEDE